MRKRYKMQEYNFYYQKYKLEWKDRKIKKKTYFYDIMQLMMFIDIYHINPPFRIFKFDNISNDWKKIKNDIS